MKPIQIFKPGKHVAASGDSFNFSESDVAATVAAYDPALHEAPIVVGHPRHDLPAYGWVKGLSLVDNALQAEPHEVDPAFAELVKARRFKKISASFYPPDSPSNPVPGVYYLRHVGFLGAQPPAIKGLRNPEFNDAEGEVISLEFSEQSYAWSILTGIARGLREYIIGKDGTEKADQMIPNWQIEQLQRAATEAQEAEAEAEAAAEPAATPAFSDPNHEPKEGESMSLTPEQIAALQAENQRLTSQASAYAAREKALAAQEAIQRNQSNVAFCESLVKSAQMHPGQKDNYVALLGALGTIQAGATGDTGAVVEFSEGGTAKQLAPADALKALLQAQPKLVEFGEVGHERNRGVPQDDPVALANAAVEFQESERKAGRNITTAEAVERITRKV